MPWQKGQSGNPLGRAVDKPIRDEIRMELAAAELDDYKLPKPNTIRGIARAIIEKAQGGDAQAFEKIADRVEGKATQPIAGDDEAPEISVAYTWLPISHAPHPTSTTRPEFISSATTSGQSDGPALSPTGGRVKQ